MKEDDTLYISKESLSELIKWNKELFDKCCNYWEDNQRLLKEKEELENKERKINEYLLKRREEWNNCQDRENINSHHYIMLIRDLLEILD